MVRLSLAIVRQTFTHFGGAERFVANAIKAITEQGHTVTLIARRWPEGSGQAHIECNPFFVGSLWRDASFARCACKAISRQNFDLVQSHERLSCCDIFRAGDGVHREWLKQRKRALGLWGRLRLSLNPYHHYVRRAESRLFSSPRLMAVICNSRMVKEEIRNHFSVPEEKLHVIYSGVDLETFNPSLARTYRTETRIRLHLPEDELVFLFVGSGYERKGLGQVLRALAILNTGHLLVVGKDKREHHFRNLAAGLGIAHRVRFLGPQKDVRPYYGASDVFVLPTLYDPFPNVALEAFASGLPVITSSKCGAAEFIREEWNGYVRDALDTEGLACAMKRTLDPALLISMQSNARTTVAELSFEEMGDALAQLYLNMAIQKKHQIAYN